MNMQIFYCDEVCPRPRQLPLGTKEGQICLAKNNPDCGDKTEVPFAYAVHFFCSLFSGRMINGS